MIQNEPLYTLKDLTVELDAPAAFDVMAAAVLPGVKVNCIDTDFFFVTKWPDHWSDASLEALRSVLLRTGDTGIASKIFTALSINFFTILAEHDRTEAAFIRLCDASAQVPTEQLATFFDNIFYLSSAEFRRQSELKTAGSSE